MAKPLYSPDEIIEQIKALIAQLGEDSFKTNGRVLLYSGPRKIIEEAFSQLEKNRIRAFKQASLELCTMIDHTQECLFLTHFDKDYSV